MLTEEIINNAYSALEDAKKKLFSSGEKTISRRANLESRKASALLNGEIEGKNAELRDAAAKLLLAPEYEALENSENDERQARYDYDLAEIEIYRIRALLRLYDATKVPHSRD